MCIPLGHRSHRGAPARLKPNEHRRASPSPPLPVAVPPAPRRYPSPLRHRPPSAARGQHVEQAGDVRGTHAASLVRGRGLCGGLSDWSPRCRQDPGVDGRTDPAPATTRGVWTVIPPPPEAVPHGAPPATTAAAAAAAAASKARRSGDAMAEVRNKRTSDSQIGVSSELMNGTTTTTTTNG